MSLLHLFPEYRPAPPEPKGVTFVQNLMGTKPTPKERKRLTPAQVRERENNRRRLARDKKPDAKQGG